MASVASAAIIEGSLIIGLDDGSIINCGFVQGPQGLKGDPGPMGATGDPGLDGNTIHTVAGTPRNDMGRDGDYAIDNINWRIYGPKSGGVWGKAKEMLPGPENIIENGRNTGAATGGGGAGSGGDGSGLVFTSTVIASGSGRLAQSGTGTTAIVNYPGSPLGMISPESGMAVQSNINAFFVRALEELEVNIPVVIDENRPQVGVYQGMLWFDASEDDYTLYIYDGNEWVPAAPPVSLEGIEQSIYHISEKLSVVETAVVETRLGIAGNAGEIETAKNRIVELEEEIESLAPSLDRGKWLLNETNPLSAGEYAMGVSVDTGYCIDQLERCMRAIPGFPDNNAMDPAAIADCNRVAGECETAKNNGELLIADWAHAAFLHFHKTDSDGKDHTFADYKVGMFIDLFDQGDTGFAVFEITAAPTLDGDIYTIGVTPVQHEGEAAGLARVKVFSLSGADPTDLVRKTGDTMTGTIEVVDPSIIVEDNELINKGYVDHVASSLFRVVDVSHTQDLENGDIWFPTNDKMYLSYKTLSGRIWATPVVSDEDLTWPQGIDAGSTGSTGRSVPDLFLAYEDPELNRPMGMTPIRQIAWPRWADTNGNPRGATGNTHVVSFTYGTSYTSFRTKPPTGTILRVRFAPWL